MAEGENNLGEPKSSAEARVDFAFKQAGILRDMRGLREQREKEGVNASVATQPTVPSQKEEGKA